jgi:hypothetical protein
LKWLKKMVMMKMHRPAKDQGVTEMQKISKPWNAVAVRLWAQTMTVMKMESKECILLQKWPVVCGS